MNDRPLGHTCAILEGSIEILEDAIGARETIDNAYFQRIVECAKRLAKTCHDAQAKA